MHVIIIFIFIVLILIFYSFVCDCIINSNSHVEYMIDFPYTINSKISEEYPSKKNNILTNDTSDELNIKNNSNKEIIPSDNNINTVKNADNINTVKNVNSETNIAVEHNNKSQTQTQIQIHTPKYDDYYDDDDDDYDDDYDDDDYDIYDPIHNTNNNKGNIETKLKSETIEETKNNDIETENNINNPYSNKKYYYNNIGTIMSGQDFIGTNIKIADNDESGQYLMPNNNYTLDDGKDGAFLLHNNMCSKSCCSEQYPVPFKLQYDKYVCQNKNELVPSSYTCNNSMQDSGCLCLTKTQGSFIYNRGGNA